MSTKDKLLRKKYMGVTGSENHEQNEQVSPCRRENRAKSISCIPDLGKVRKNINSVTLLTTSMEIQAELVEWDCGSL